MTHSDYIASADITKGAPCDTLRNADPWAMLFVDISAQAKEIQVASVTRNIAVVQGAASESLQSLLAEAVHDLRAEGTKVVGVMAEGMGAPDRMCTAGFLRDIGSGDEFQIYLEETPTDTSCDLDAKGVNAACAAVLSQIATCDLVVLSKFGKLEAMGQGLFRAFEAAIAAGCPVVTTVSPKHREAWEAFAPDAAYIEANKPALTAWLARL